METPNDSNWPRASTWLHDPNPHPLGHLGIVGAPVHLGSITPGRCDLAPHAIRAALARFSTYDLATEHDVRSLAVHDFGNIDVADLQLEQAFQPISEALRTALSETGAVVLLGGDNGITRPGCHAVSSGIERCGLITLDAHLDVRDLGHGLSNGNPVRALLADGLAGTHIVQIGLQSFTNSRAYHEIALAAGITVIPVDRVHEDGIDIILRRALTDLARSVEGIYVDLDVDVLDRAFAPATPGSRPGGLTPWQIRRAARICGEHPKVRVMDLVEIDPERDIADVTVMSAAACLLSFAGGLVERLSALHTA